MRNRLILAQATSFFFALGIGGFAVTPTAGPDVDPTGNTGALKSQIETGGGYLAHSGSATRSITDLRVPGALGVYGLDFTRHYNSLRNDRVQKDFDTVEPAEPIHFGSPGWSHSWAWSAAYAEEPLRYLNDSVTEYIYRTSITITFPDGHATKYKISRYLNDQRWGQPYTAAEINSGWPDGGYGVDDHLAMAANGSNFWLHRADGGSVHFVRGTLGYQATEVFDRHGLKTVLHYNPEGNLDWVQQDGGRKLTILWDAYCVPPQPGAPNHCSSRKVIGRVEYAGATRQAVEYGYSWLDRGLSSKLTLTSVVYKNELVPGSTSLSPTARYTYENYVPPTGFFFVGPRLVTADDRHFEGPMRFIRYGYQPGCTTGATPTTERYLGAHNDYFYASPTSIASEKSGKTGVAVSRFVINCFEGTRIETNGLGAQRTFYFGLSSGTTGNEHRGYQLTKLTDFAMAPIPADLPFERQNYLNGHPRQVWDGRGTLTELVYEDGSGSPNEIRNVGSDGSTYRYNRISPGSSEARNASLVPNPYNHWLFSKTNELNQTTTYTRDSRRRIKRIDYPDLSFETFVYNDFNQVTSHRLPSGATITYEYDARGLLKKEYNSEDGDTVYTAYTYYTAVDHPEWADLVATVQNPRARAAGKAYSTMMRYNGRHQITEVHYPATGPNPDPFVKYEYDENGNCTAITNELGFRSTYEYDEYSRCIAYTEPLNAAAHNGTGTVASRTWNWVYDRVNVLSDGSTTSVSPSAHTSKKWRLQQEPPFNAAGDRRTTVRQYDYNDRLSFEATGAILSPAGSFSYTDSATTSYTYDKNGNKNKSTDPKGRATIYEYDLRDRLKKTIEPLNRVTENSYDPAGNKTLVKFPDLKTQEWKYFDAFGQPRQFFDEGNHITDLEYWPWGPMKKLAKVTTHRIKDDSQVENQVTAFFFDLTGRPRRTNFPDGSFEQTDYAHQQVLKWYTRKGAVKTITSYDARGREKAHTWSDGTPGVTREWDDAGRLLSLANRFSTIDYGYDRAGQVSVEGSTVAGSSGVAPAGTGVRKQLSYYRYLSGEVSQVIYPNGFAVQRAHTARRQLQSASWSGGSVSYKYLPDDKVDYQDYGNGVRSDLDYDGRGYTKLTNTHRISPVQVYSKRTYWRDTRDRIYAWGKSNAPTYNPLENGRGDRYGYDAEGQLTTASYEALTPAATPSGAKRSDRFSYDALGNRQGWNYLANRGSMNFTRRNNGLNQYWSWENNIAAPGHWGTVIYHDDNSPWAPWNAYPGNGVTMADGWITASYNSLNQPVAMIPNDGSSGAHYFGYDPLGRCVKRWVSASGTATTNPATYLYYDGWNLVQEGRSATAVADRLYVHGRGVDEIVAQITPSNNVMRYFHYDGRGHCILQTDTMGNLTEQYGYDAFGWPYFYNAAGQATTVNGRPGSPWGNRFLFTGREWLSNLKIYDYRNRMYQPELGRFLQPDPIQFKAGDYNLYRYCHNDPVNRNDPFGLRWAPMSEKDKKQYEAAKERASKSEAGKRLFNKIEKSRTTFTLRINSKHDDSYDPKTKTVNWDPKSALKIPDGGKQSPATGLAHEIDHALTNPMLYDIRKMIPAGKYDDMEEARVIKGSERAIVRDLGEGMRQAHDGEPYHVRNPADR